ncbi:MAG: tetratricopeptide repeat protein [Bacteroidales bacterium]|jgi:antitoxin component YwqK of YwqJK toxin-antitoxin module|nr:tetratricopeptide repeat protein [Bacteroidales bacterium]
MKITYSFLTICLLYSITTQVFSQKNAQPENYRDSVITAIYKIDEQEHEIAERLLSSVPTHDTIYNLAQYEQGLNFLNGGKFEEAIAVYSNMTKTASEYNHRAYSGWAIALDSLEKDEESLAVFDKGIAEYTHHYLLYFNKATTLQGMERYQEAVEYYKKTILYAPGHVTSHIRLGVLAAEEGEYTRAMLSLFYATMMSSTAEQKHALLEYMESISDLNIEIDKKGIDFGDDKIFRDVDLIFQNQIALSKDIKDLTKLKWSLTKQLYMIFDALAKEKKYSTDNTDFWVQTYLPKYIDIYTTGNYTGMVYLTISDIESKKIQKRVKKGQKDVSNFVAWLRENWDYYNSTQYMNFNNSWQKVSFYITEGDLLGGMGLKNEDKEPIGAWEYYHTNGRIRSSGNFVDGEREGEWEWLYANTGTIDESITYKDGSLNGKHRTYREDGSLKSEAEFVDGKYSGHYYFFSRYGDTLSDVMLEEGVRNGEFLSYYPNGTLKEQAFFKDGDLDSTNTIYFPNGNIKSTASYTENEANGEFTTYYFNGQVKIKGNYIEDELNGEYTTYYQNGNIESIGAYKEHSAVGPWKHYYYNGSLEKEIEYDEKGKINATLKAYDRDGNHFKTEEYKNGESLAITYTNTQNKVVYETKKSRKNLEFKSFLPDGTIQTEGLLEDDNKEGEWIYYTKYGAKKSAENYSEGEIVDQAVDFYPCGAIKAKRNYSDDKQDGLQMNFFSHDTIEYEGYYRNDTITGSWFFYYNDGTLRKQNYFTNDEISYSYTCDVTGKKDYEYYYKEDELILEHIYDSTGTVQQTIEKFHGTVKIVNPHSKKLYAELTYTNGEFNGSANWYYFNGTKSCSGSYLNGERHGLWKWYAPNGVVTTKIPYENGDIHGTLKRFHSATGKIYAEELYEYDTQQGLETYYHPNGKIHFSRSYVDDEIHGTVVYYSEAGNVYQIRYFDMGKLIGYSYHGKDGKPIDMIPFEGTGKAVFYYSTGEKSLEWERVNGKLDGDFIRYAEDGSIMEKETYVKNERHGNAYRMSAPGVKWYDVNLFYGNYNGTYTMYYLNGKPYSQTEYHNNKEQGTEKVYNKKGEQTHLRTYYDGIIINERKL